MSADTDVQIRIGMVNPYATISWLDTMARILRDDADRNRFDDIDRAFYLDSIGGE